ACRAGTAFNRTGTAMVHALSFILSEEWHVPHGAACAFTLEDGVRINREDPAIAAKLGRIGAGGPDALGDRIIAMKRAMGLPFTFRDIGAELGGGDIDRLFAKAFDDPKMKNNAAPVPRDRVFEMLRSKL
ncbi:MAG: iron-containing alcohol dehydrogenase, partial [Verrucomicrobiae bacterium]|nr:iron-containing alcohol dehydrogenase [Verrucomicrobiae bacterium]